MKDKILHGDCLELMPDIPSGSIDMILCDLPYGTTACKWDTIIPFEPLWEQYKRIIKPNEAIVLTASQPFTTDLINSNRKMFKYELIWHKDKPSDFGNSNIKPLRYHENILVFYFNTPTYNKSFEKRDGSGANRAKYDVNFKPNLNEHGFGMKAMTIKPRAEEKAIGSVIKMTTGCRGEIKHPTVKPVPLFEHLIRTYTNEGETVLDNCAGSGTTGIACINTNRNYILMEKEQKYFDIIEKRIRERLSQTKLNL